MLNKNKKEILKKDMSKIIKEVTILEKVAKNREKTILKIIDVLSQKEEELLDKVIQIINNKYLNQEEKEDIESLEYDYQRKCHANGLSNQMERQQYLTVIAISEITRRQRKEERKRENYKRIEKIIDIPEKFNILEGKEYFIMQVQVILHSETGGMIKKNIEVE